MASGFIALEDGRCWAGRWTLFDALIENITDNLTAKETEEFKSFLKGFLPNDNDIEMGYAFIRETNGENVTRHIDLREIAPVHRTHFWSAAQSAMSKISRKKQSNEIVKEALELLLKMHKSVLRNEPPEASNDWREPGQETGNKIGPGW